MTDMTGGYDLFGRVSTQDTGERSALDFYESPRWATCSLLRHHPAIIGMRVFEPCAGRDAITLVLREAGCEVLTNDIDRRQPSVLHEDATGAALWRSLAGIRVEFDWVVTNTAFDVAFEILQHAVEHARVGVALLLRKTFLEPTRERGPWLAAHPPTRCIGLPRHSFRGSGSDSVSCDWMLWEREPDRRQCPFVIDADAETRRTWA